MRKVDQKSYLEKLKKPGVQSKFLIGLALILLCFCGLSSSIIYFYQKKGLEEEAFSKTELVMSSVAATRSYVSNILRPKMYDVLGEDAFIIEAMSSSYISRKVMDIFNERLPEFRYRRVAINARNPDFEANEIEKQMISFFRDNPEAKTWQDIVRVGEERYFIRYSPVSFTKPCLHCHGIPEAAPEQIINMYGTTGGFNHKPGEITSVVSVGIPVETGLKKIKGAALSVFSTAFLVIFFLYAIIIFFFNKLIIQNLRSLLDMFWGNLDDEYGRQLYEKTKSMDEIGELNSAAEIMAGHLQETKNNLQQSIELLQSVFDGITDFVVLVSPSGQIRMVNKAISDQFELNLGDILNKNIKELAQSYPLPFNLFTKVIEIQLKEPVADLITCSSGEVFDVHFFPVFTEDGRLANIICYAKDVTFQKLAEKKIQQTEKLVSMGQLAAGVAHEINNPLGIILTYTDLLKEDLQGNSQQIDDLQIIEKHVRNCQRIVSDLLNFASPGKTKTTQASINEVIQDALLMLKQQFKKKKIELKRDLHPELPLLDLDVEKIKQVFINLAMNAIQAIGESGTVSISSSLSKELQQVKVVVEDNGPGIAPEQIDKIFDPFFTTKEPGEGTGLGLSLSYGIIQDHGGDINVKSRINQGTTFTITLPIQGLGIQKNNQIKKMSN
ncbi:MAG: DUF3365 domain-containing protein [Deltaproteobacteria bacterium]|jgi:signal transduction histidine kinase|nr:DUF3365 domain-containing protein [Deltaproteobacteria bacterium]